MVNKSFEDFLLDFKNTLHSLFHVSNNIDEFSHERGLPPEVLKGIMEKTPLSVAVPKEYGGRGSSVKDVLALLEVTSYESLPLSLVFGINIGLFQYPVSKFGNEEVKKSIFKKFIEEQSMGGLMITEPNHGSDALNMQTSYQKVNNTYHLNGTKHWQGLTGSADYWLIAAREKLASGNLGRDIEFFISDSSQKNQQIVVEEYYKAMGLYMIPYGKNKVDIQVPLTAKLEPKTTGIKMLLDTLHRSRMQFPGMAMGFIKRMLEEAIKHCNSRLISAGNLLSLDQIEYQITRIQSAFTMCSAMCVRSSEISDLEKDLSGLGLEANCIKAVVTDLMHESAQIMVQLAGANGYKMSHVAGRGIMDSRPFQIFEGSNEMLYIQVADLFTKMMKKEKESNLFDFLKSFDLTKESSLYFKKEISFIIQSVLTQRKLFDLGKIISRIISIGYVIELGAKGFRTDLVNNCIETLKQEVSMLISSLHSTNQVCLVENYTDNSAWVNFSK
jgi:alkylation response protein AidB-like acyl-CoA dehydrogenase